MKSKQNFHFTEFLWHSSFFYSLPLWSFYRVFLNLCLHFWILDSSLADHRQLMSSRPWTDRVHQGSCWEAFPLLKQHFPPQYICCGKRTLVIQHFSSVFQYILLGLISSYTSHRSPWFLGWALSSSEVARLRVFRNSICPLPHTKIS